jgi:hypothetical protein
VGGVGELMAAPMRIGEGDNNNNNQVDGIKLSDMSRF